jgi:pseudoazurin
MSKPSIRLQAAMVALTYTMLSTGVCAAEVEVKMLNKGSDGSMMVFEPALVRIKPGDSVHFIATDKSHDVQSIAGMIPEGAQPFAGKMNEDLVVKLDKPGVYGYECKPHYGMGMVGLIVVGKPVNEAAVKASVSPSMPPFAKNKFVKFFGELDK